MQVATRLLEVFEKLKQLGHPTFSQSQFVYTLACSDSSLDADEKVCECFGVLMMYNVLLSFALIDRCPKPRVP